MKAWDKFKADSKEKMEMAKSKMKRKERRKVNKVTISDEEILAFRSLADLHASVADLKAQAAANKVAYKKAMTLQWMALEEKYELGGKFFVDMEEECIYQLGRKI